MARIIILALGLALIPADPTFACSFKLGYAPFELDNTRLPMTGKAPPDPTVLVKSIKRGFDDGNSGSCSDAGILTLEVDETGLDQRVGYHIEWKSGNFPAALLPDEIVAPIRLPEGGFGFYFVWGDFSELGHGEQPIDAELTVRSVSETGIEGASITVRIKDP